MSKEIPRSEEEERIDTSEARRLINEAVGDGSGCAETWEALSEIRTGSPDGSPEAKSSRRSFITRVAMTMGVIPIGASATASASKSGDRTNDKEGQSIEASEVHGQKRAEILRAANTSQKVDFVADKLGERGDVASVFEYALQSGTTGRGVTYGAADESAGSTIRYYESDSFEDGTWVTGGKPSGGGVISVDADNEVIIDVHDTPRLEKSMNLLEDNEEYSALKQGLSDSMLVEEEAIMTYSLSDPNGHTEVLIPIEKDDEIVDRAVLSGQERPSSSNIHEYSVASSIGDEFTTQVQFDGCAALCTALTAAGAVGCTGACLAFPATISLAPYCGQLCTAVAVGTCGATCNDIF